LGDSKAFLEDVLDAAVPYFAPPGGIGCRWVRHDVERQGYLASRSMVWGIYRSLDQRWTIPCVPVTEFTLARGWVTRVLSAHALPFEMRSAWVVKSMASGLAPALRRVFHAPFKTGRPHGVLRYGSRGTDQQGGRNGQQ
jgi:hypothetical protein